MGLEGLGVFMGVRGLEFGVELQLGFAMVHEDYSGCIGIALNIQCPSPNSA